MSLALPTLDGVPEVLRVLVAAGVAMFLVLLRFDAERFCAAEFDDIDRWGNPPSLARRIAWYALGVIGILGVIVLHPAPSSDLFLGLGDRVGSIGYGLAYGIVGSALAVGFAYLRFRSLRLPQVRSYPGAVINAVATAFVDEAVFRGIVFGFLLAIGTDVNLANVAQLVLYALATRMGAPGRPIYMLLAVLAIGLVGGWLTGLTGGIGAAFLGHAITRVAIYFVTGHAGLLAGPGTEADEVGAGPQMPDGWQMLAPDTAEER